MSNRTIYIFWIGDSNKIANKIDFLNNKGFEVKVGPSKIDHDFLYENVAFYRRSYDEKIWSFCSDVWRVYILSKNIGMYIDATTLLGEDFVEFYDFALSFQTYLVRLSYSFIDGQVMASNINNNGFFIDCMKVYLNLPDRHERTVFFAGDILSFISRNYAIPNSWEKFNNGLFYVDIPQSIRNKTTIYKYSTSSWKVNGNSDEKDAMEEIVSLFNAKKIPKFVLSHQQLIDHNGIYSVNIGSLRGTYDISNKSVRKELAEVYRNKGYFANIKYWLLWSRLFVLFTFWQKR